MLLMKIASINMMNYKLLNTEAVKGHLRNSYAKLKAYFYVKIEIHFQKQHIF